MSKANGMPPGSDDLVVIGEITKPHGIRGEVCVLLHTDSPSLLDGLALQLRQGPNTPKPKEEDPPSFARGGKRGGRRREYRPRRPRRPRMQRREVVSWRQHKGALLLTLEGIEDRSQAEALRGFELLIRESDLPELEDGEFYLSQLVGLEVRLEDGSTLGHVQDVLVPAGQELWSIVTPEGHEVLFPVAEEFIRSVDPDEDCVVIAPPPGLLELYLDAEDSSSENAS
ncbi:ribosome maturation factor RimM [Desulfobaculum bizertense]|uniref:Ribosome maturation factor RimM n=1 Tax=Desulfobaculum bizertense DSM 18034 TaxID=1121442 RepID=A0A1T4VHZ4_9BACT|nr:ribosome maturation factor RimM [Desulfobaculum bizertense]UIJ37876.1 ribosome maturation factor RimM [Desulfobaculum bizertense]SKA64562.1 16S rRNA processing protein RimM [Desulfobaculum bizertense DSM 18034]